MAMLSFRHNLLLEHESRATRCTLMSDERDPGDRINLDSHKAMGTGTKE